MKTAVRYVILICSAVFGFRPGIQAQIIPERSEVTFSVKHVTGTVEGKITGMQGTVIFDENNLPGSRMEATVEARTVDTDNRARDSDLRKEKFFDVDDHPQIKFRSREITRSGDGYQVDGDLTIKNRVQPVVIPFRREVTDGEAVFTGSFTLKRKDFDLGKGVFPPIGKEVEVKIVAAVRR